MAAKNAHNWTNFQPWPEPFNVQRKNKLLLNFSAKEVITDHILLILLHDLSLISNLSGLMIHGPLSLQLVYLLFEIGVDRSETLRLITRRDKTARRWQILVLIHIFLPFKHRSCDVRIVNLFEFGSNVALFLRSITKLLEGRLIVV